MVYVRISGLIIVILILYITVELNRFYIRLLIFLLMYVLCSLLRPEVPIFSTPW